MRYTKKKARGKTQMYIHNKLIPHNVYKEIKF